MDDESRAAIGLQAAERGRQGRRRARRGLVAARGGRAEASKASATASARAGATGQEQPMVDTTTDAPEHKPAVDVMDVLEHKPVDARTAVNELFDAIDRDGSGSIEMSEFFKGIRAAARRPSSTRQPAKHTQARKKPTSRALLGTTVAAADTTQSLAEQIVTALTKSRQRVLRLFQDWDENANGTISRDELYRAVLHLGFVEEPAPTEAPAPEAPTPTRRAVLFDKPQLVGTVRERREASESSALAAARAAARVAAQVAANRVRHTEQGGMLLVEEGDSRVVASLDIGARGNQLGPECTRVTAGGAGGACSPARKRAHQLPGHAAAGSSRSRHRCASRSTPVEQAAEQVCNGEGAMSARVHKATRTSDGRPTLASARMGRPVPDDVVVEIEHSLAAAACVESTPRAPGSAPSSSRRSLPSGGSASRRSIIQRHDRPLLHEPGYMHILAREMQRNGREDLLEVVDDQGTSMHMWGQDWTPRQLQHSWVPEVRQSIAGHTARYRARARQTLGVAAANLDLEPTISCVPADAEASTPAKSRRKGRARGYAVRQHLLDPSLELDGISNRRRIPADGVTTDAYDAFVSARAQPEDGGRAPSPVSWTSTPDVSVDASPRGSPSMCRAPRENWPSAPPIDRDQARGDLTPSVLNIVQQGSYAVASGTSQRVSTCAKARALRHASATVSLYGVHAHARAAPKASQHQGEQHAFSTSALTALRAERAERRALA